MHNILFIYCIDNAYKNYVTLHGILMRDAAAHAVTHPIHTYMAIAIGIHCATQ